MISDRTHPALRPHPSTRMRSSKRLERQRVARHDAAFHAGLSIDPEATVTTPLGSCTV